MAPFSLPAPFRVRSYRYQWPADLLVSWAFEMETLILGWYVLVETGSVLWLTLYGSLLYVGTLIAPILGVASDRVGHRSLLTAMRAAYAAVAGTLMTLAFSGALNPLFVLVLAAFSGMVRPSDMGLRGALVAETMPPEHLTAAMGISRTTSDIARIFGALLGAGMFAAFGIGPAYIAITSFYLLGAALTWLTEARTISATVPAAASVSPAASPWRDLREGIAHIWVTPGLLALVWLAFLYNGTAFSITNGLLPYVAKDIYRIDQTGLGYLVASLSLGALTGSLVMAWSRVATDLTRIMVIFGVVWHVLILLFAQMQNFWGGVILLWLVGVAQSLTMVAHTVLLLRASSQRFRGRVLGVRMMAIYSLPLGLLASGVLIGWVGFHASASFYALIGIVFTVLIAMKWRDYLWRKGGPAA